MKSCMLHLLSHSTYTFCRFKWNPNCSESHSQGVTRHLMFVFVLPGDGLSLETLDVLVKMAPTADEATKFLEYEGDPSMLGPAERFVLGLLQVPNAFERLDVMHYRASFREDLHHIQDAIYILEVSC